MHIDVGIPWEPGRRLGHAVNRFMAKVDSWGLILDWDVSLVNVHWYDICMETIAKVKDTAGLITCMTNRIGCPLQRDGGAPQSDDLDAHRAYALKVQEHNHDQLLDITDQTRWKLSGLFFLTPRHVFDRVGPAPADKFIGFDNWYHDRVREAGYRIFIMKDLYCYHGYRRQWNTKPSGGSV